MVPGMMRLLAGISAVGLLLSLACHVFGWLQVDPPGGQAAMCLHIGIFIVWIPLVFLANRTMPKKAGKGNLDHLLAELPKWATVGVMVLFVYALLNFVHFMVMTSRFPKNQVPFSLVLRGFSGHWMMFYGIAVAGFIGLARLAHKRRQNSTDDLNQSLDEWRQTRPGQMP